MTRRSSDAAWPASRRPGPSSSSATTATSTPSACRRTGSPQHDAEDVFQETFARVYEHLATLKDPAALRPWIGQVARRLCVDRIRGSGREVVSEEVEPREADETMARLDEALSVHQAMTGLPEHCQEVLDRFFCRDQSYHEIGAALDIPSGTIASRISRCLTRLKELFGGR